MDYFKILHFLKEPFSNSPDPEFLFESQQHKNCLQQLEISLRLRRGLNVLIGDIGTGKTTLCYQLIRRFDREEKVETHLILDPYFTDPLEFLSNVAGMFLGEPISKEAMSVWRLKEKIKHYLFAKGVDGDKIIVLIIDEGQKMPPFCLEILREFLNYETNRYKLLQIVILAQKEFKETLKKHANFADRINLYHFLGPLNFRDTRTMIQFRLKRAHDSSESPSLFSYLAMRSVYRATQGYPRKIIHLCHRIILDLIIQNRSKANWFLARSCARRVLPQRSRKWQWVTATALTCLVAAFLLLTLAPWPFKVRVPWGGKDSNRVSTQRHEGSPGVVTLKISPPPADKPTTVASAKPRTKSSANTLVGDLTKPVRALIHETVVPRLLGQITVKEQETVASMISTVYGRFKNEYLLSLKLVNPHIQNLGKINPGEVVSFPATHIVQEPLPGNGWWIQVAEKERLENAYQFLRVYPKDRPPRPA